MKKWFWGPYGLRAGWKAAILLVCAYIITLIAGRGLNALAEYFFGVWGLTQKNIHRAPGWILLITGYWGQWASIAQNLLLWPLSLLLCRLLCGKTPPRGRGAGRALAIGGAAGLMLVALLLATDAVRLGRSLLRPAWSWEIIISLCGYASAALGGEALFRGALRISLERLPTWLASALGAAAFSVMSAPALRPLGLVNLFLLGILLDCAARYTGGYIPGAAARFSMYAALFTLAGCAGGAPKALYECYPAAHDLLSGGSQGPMYGLMATLILFAAVSLWMYKQRGDIFVRE